jgi:hypothetical protein
MSERSDWGDLRERRMAESGAREGYAAEKRAYELGQAVKARRVELGMTQKELGETGAVDAISCSAPRGR